MWHLTLVIEEGDVSELSHALGIVTLAPKLRPIQSK